VKSLSIILLLLLGVVQFGLWASPNGLQDLMRMNNDIEMVRGDVDRLIRKNRFLEAEVLDLRTGTEALEERARSDLGMILADETFFQVIEAPGNSQAVQPYSIIPGPDTQPDPLRNPPSQPRITDQPTGHRETAVDMAPIQSTGEP